MDDDTTTMTQLQNKTYGGKLDDAFVTPTKRGDVNHRVRGLGNQCNELATMNMTSSRVNKKITSRVKKGFACKCFNCDLLLHSMYLETTPNALPTVLPEKHKRQNKNTLPNSLTYVPRCIGTSSKTSSLQFQCIQPLTGSRR
eukprot:9345881-Ditylum_brightwellii.AAC.1